MTNCLPRKRRYYSEQLIIDFQEDKKKLRRDDEKQISKQIRKINLLMDMRSSQDEDERARTVDDEE